MNAPHHAPTGDTAQEIAAPGVEPRSDRFVRLLIRAGRVLGSSLNLDQTLRQLLDLLVPELGDVCVLQLFGPDGRTVEVELTHAIPKVAGPVSPRSTLTAPLRTPERTWGALSVALTEGGTGKRVFGPTDQALLEEIANRAALAVSHARLFHEAESARAAAEYAAQLTDRLHRVTAALGTAAIVWSRRRLAAGPSSPLPSSAPLPA